MRVRGPPAPRCGATNGSAVPGRAPQPNVPVHWAHREERAAATDTSPRPRAALGLYVGLGALTPGLGNCCKP
eukprot:5048585-Heterocapsa_arctica.AAC.1